MSAASAASTWSAERSREASIPQAASTDRRQRCLGVERGGRWRERTTAEACGNTSIAVPRTEPLRYQWRFNSEGIPGATWDSYTRINVRSSDAGSYSVVVSNSVGAVTSASAALVVNGGQPNVPPTVELVSPYQTVNQGEDATFSCYGTGRPTPTYQWRFNGLDIPGATATSYTRHNCQPPDAGSYTAVASNMLGWATSGIGLLTVRVPPTLTTQPHDGSVVAGDSVCFSVVVSGTPPFNYQWRFNGTNIAGATTNLYCRSNVQTNDEGSYSVVVTNLAGSVTSGVAVLTVKGPPHIDQISVVPAVGIQLQVTGAAGHYAIEAATNTLDWLEATNFTTTGSSFQYLDPQPDPTNRFYRVRLVP